MLRFVLQKERSKLRVMMCVSILRVWPCAVATWNESHKSWTRVCPSVHQSARQTHTQITHSKFSRLATPCTRVFCVRVFACFGLCLCRVVHRSFFRGDPAIQCKRTREWSRANYMHNRKFTTRTIYHTQVGHNLEKTQFFRARPVSSPVRYFQRTRKSSIRQNISYATFVMQIQNIFGAFRVMKKNAPDQTSIWSMNVHLHRILTIWLYTARLIGSWTVCAQVVCGTNLRLSIDYEFRNVRSMYDILRTKVRDWISGIVHHHAKAIEIIA